MNLKSGTLLWVKQFPNAPQYPVLDHDLTCDVVVVGSGESGALAAWHLLESGLDVVVIDKRKIGQGSTSANTGLLQFSNDKGLAGCVKTFGEADGVRYYKLCQQAVDDLENISNQLEINTEYRRRDSLYYASSEEDLKALQEEYNLLNKHGFPVTFFEQGDIEEHFSFSKTGAIYAKNDADINPYRLAVSIMNHAAKAGVRIYQETTMSKVKASDNGVTVHTKQGNVIRAKHAVIACGYETQEMKRNPSAIIESTYAVTTQPLDSFPGWHRQCLIWETKRPYLYLRTTADQRILLGGMDEPAVRADERDAKLFGKRNALLQEVRNLFPEMPDLEAEYFWSAAFGSTHDGYPFFGTQPEFPNCFFLLGYGGNGTVYSTIGSQVIRDLIMKGSNPDAHLFQFNRGKYRSAQ
ncbi:FAD-dependent oxidoreductase [Bacillus tianshenii]|nr:FAD-dependent oxidoreductase [Bacillus tianshenii]